jgi:putative transposase
MKSKHKIMNDKSSLQYGCYYHIYNRGNNRQDIFFEEENYLFFLNRLDLYMSPFCDIISWVLLKNHFHLFIYVKSAKEIDLSKLKYTATEIPKKIDVSLQFGHFFNSYAKAINKRFKRTGSLFEKNFERKEVVNKDCFKSLIHYIHRNPVSHGFSENISNYPWSSYGSLFSQKPTRLNRQFVLDLFLNEKSLNLYLNSPLDYEDIKDIIIE